MTPTLWLNSAEIVNLLKFNCYTQQAALTKAAERLHSAIDKEHEALEEAKKSQARAKETALVVVSCWVRG